MKKPVLIPVMLILASLLVSCGTKSDAQAEAGTVSSKEEALSQAESTDVETGNGTEKEGTKPADAGTDIIQKFYREDSALEEVILGSNKGGEKTPLYRVKIPDNYYCSAAYYSEENNLKRLKETVMAPRLSEIVEKKLLEDTEAMPAVITGSSGNAAIAVEITDDSETMFVQLKENIMSGDHSDLYEAEGSFSVRDDAYSCYRDCGDARILRITFQCEDKTMTAKDFYDFCGKIITEIK